MNLTLTPLRLVLIVLVIGSLCFLFKNLVEAYTSRCDHRIDVIAKSGFCSRAKMIDCTSCFKKRKSQMVWCCIGGFEVNQKIQNKCKNLVPTPPPGPTPTPTPPPSLDTCDSITCGENTHTKTNIDDT